MVDPIKCPTLECFLNWKYEMYWIGKKPKTREAIEEYIKDPSLRRMDIVIKYDISETTIEKRIRELKKIIEIPPRRRGRKSIYVTPTEKRKYFREYQRKRRARIKKERERRRTRVGVLGKG